MPIRLGTARSDGAAHRFIGGHAAPGHAARPTTYFYAAGFNGERSFCVSVAGGFLKILKICAATKEETLPIELCSMVKATDKAQAGPPWSATA